MKEIYVPQPLLQDFLYVPAAMMVWLRAISCFLAAFLKCGGELWTVRGNLGTLFQLLSYQHGVVSDNNFSWSAGYTLKVASMRCGLSVIREYAVSSFSAWHQRLGSSQQGKMSVKTDASFGVGGMQSLKTSNNCSLLSLSKEKDPSGASLWVSC